MTARKLHFIVPGPLAQCTGGYIYDARMVDGLRDRGWGIDVHSLSGRFPLADETARANFANVLAEIPSGVLVVIDGLALAADPSLLERHRGRLRLLALVHHPLSEETGLDRQTRAQLAVLESRALQAVCGVVVTSEFTARELERFGVNGACVRIVAPGTDAAPLASGPPPEAPLQLLVVAAVIPRKGHEVLVRALDRIRDRPWQCICAGSLDRDVSYAEGVIAKVEGLGLSDRIEFVGECDRAMLDRLYSAASLFVLPSYFEGYGMVLTEALARGLPIISTTGGAIPDVVTTEIGLLVQPGNDEALSEAIGSLIGDGQAETARGRLIAAAVRYRSRILSWDKAVEKMENALIGLASESSISEEPVA